jgi:hypothetical protein
MAARKRKGPRHKGVVLIRPDPVRRIGWRARYLDPDLDKQVKVSLDPALTTTEVRTDWAVRKAREIADRRLEIERGEPRLVRKPILEAVNAYLERADNELRASTLELYRSALVDFQEWASRTNVAHTSDLTARKLPEFRDHLLAQRKRSLVRGGKRGSRKPSDEKLSPHTINWKLRAVKTVLSEFRKRGLVPLSSDAIKDSLKPVPTPREAPEFLIQRDCARLLDAVVRHDSDKFARTRAEHALQSAPWMTHRYEPIGPLVVCALFTGMRFNELLNLKWGDVELDAKGSDGTVVGEIHLRATATKTKHARTLGSKCRQHCAACWRYSSCARAVPRTFSEATSR